MVPKAEALCFLNTRLVALDAYPVYDPGLLVVSTVTADGRFFWGWTIAPSIYPVAVAAYHEFTVTFIQGDGPCANGQIGQITHMSTSP